MKIINHLKTALLQASLIIAILFSTSSCMKNQKSENTKDVAEEHNEAKFDDATKEQNAQFLVNAAEINLEEISLGQLARQNGTISAIKDLGKMMEEAHTRSQNGLAALAGKKTITIPTSATDNARDAYKKLLGKSGVDFDKTYCDMMVNGHKDAIAVFEKASADSSDADIREWAIATLPGLRVHLDHAITCQKKFDKM